MADDLPELIKFSDLKDDHPLALSEDDLIAIAVENQSSETGYSSLTTTPAQLAQYAVETQTFANLKTSQKTVENSINQVVSNLAPDYDATSTYAVDDCVLYEGNIYKCIIAIPVAEAWDSTHWTQIKAVDVGSGGGGSGHTIVDEGGTSLTQRTNLQFNGAYLEDNSTDDTTEVNVAREMTKAEFDLLSNDEKQGIINVTDITSGTEDKFQPVIYSEDEHEIGVWLDGKPVYEKTIDFSSDLTVSYNGWTETTEDCSTVDRYLLGNGYTNSGTYAGNILCSKKSNNKLEIQTPRNGTTQSVRYLTVRYTKTTDTAGSGQWTPQGVPAHHYSTDEQIVGTWIDGSTLYEKTFFLSQRTPITNDYTTYIIDDTTIYDIDNIISCEIFDSNSDSAPLTKLAYLERAVDVIKSNNKLIAFYNANNTYKMTGFILRYTKSSS